jgi:NAD(P)-dependent dehydrogenase (short-subunit alcohol dehydrogenase family)
VIEPGDPLGRADGLVHLRPIERAEDLGALFALTKAAVESDAKWIVAATPFGGDFGHGTARPAGAWGGVSGLLKSVAKERPDLRVRAIDLCFDEDPARLAEHLYAELLVDDGRVEVGYRGGVRRALRVVPREPMRGAPGLELDRSGVVLVTGGGRGITAEVAVAIAREFGCALEVVGRTPWPAAPEDAELASRTDAAQIRRLLLERANGAGPAKPSVIEQMCQRVLAERELRRTKERIEAAGGRFRYHALDVRDEAAFGALIEEVYARCGRLDGVIHGAGVTDDKLVAHKTRAAFDRVVETKVRGAVTLARRLRDDVRFVAFFSSVSGAFGNRGQTDYAAANDALDKLAHELRARLGGRVFSINWGPWEGVGMVSAELGREYASRGIGLIAPDEGARRFVEELRFGEETQVVITAPAEGFMGSPVPAPRPSAPLPPTPSTTDLSAAE